MQRSTTGHGSQEAGKRVESQPSVPGERESMGTTDSRAQMAQGQGTGKAKRRTGYSKPWKLQPAAAKTLVSVSGCQTSEQDLAAGGGAATKFLQATPESPREAAKLQVAQAEGFSADGSQSLLAKSLGNPAAAAIDGEENEEQGIVGASAGLPMATLEPQASEASPMGHKFDPEVSKRVSLASVGPRGQSTHSEGQEYLAAGARTGLLNFRVPSQGEDSPVDLPLLGKAGEDAGLTCNTEASAINAKRGPLQIRQNEARRLSTVSQHSPGTLKDESLYKSGFAQKEPAGLARESPHGTLPDRENPGASVDLQKRGHVRQGNGLMDQTGPPPDWAAWSREWARHHCPHCEHTKPPRLAAVRDMGSLKLTEVLRFQQDGRCCRSFCQHCRRTHKCELARQVQHIDYSRGADAGELLKTTPRPFDLEIQRLTRSSRPRRASPGSRPTGEQIQTQNQSPRALGRQAGRRSQAFTQEARADAMEALRVGASGVQNGVQLCIDGVVASRVLKKQPITVAPEEGARRVRRSFDSKTKRIFPGSGMSFSLDKKIDSRIVIENAHESASLDSAMDPHRTLPRGEEKRGAMALRRSQEGLGGRGESQVRSDPQSLVHLEGVTSKGPSPHAPAEGRARPPWNVQTSTGDGNLDTHLEDASPGRLEGRRSSCDTGSPQKSSAWHRISPRLGSPERGPGEPGPTGPGTHRPLSPQGPDDAPEQMSLKAVQQMENQRRTQGSPGGVSISVKVPGEVRTAGQRDGEGVDSNGQRLKNVSQINLALEQTLESQNAEGGLQSGTKPTGNSVMTYVVVDMADGERSQPQNKGSENVEERKGLARAHVLQAPNVHVVNSSMIATHQHKQTMPFNHFRHPAMAGVAESKDAWVGSPGSSEPMQNRQAERRQPILFGPVVPYSPSPRRSIEPETALWPGNGFARSLDKTPPEIHSGARGTSPRASKAAPTVKSDALNKDLLPFSAATEDGTGDLPRGEIEDSGEPLRALNTARGAGAEAVSERFQNRSIQSKIAKTMASPGVLRNSVEQSRNRWPEGQQNLSSSAVASCESKVVLLTRGGRDSQLIREATRGAGFRIKSPKPLCIPGTEREAHAGGGTSRSTAERGYRLTSTFEGLQTKLRGSNALEGVQLRGSDGAPTPSLGASASPVKLRSTFFFGSRTEERGSSQFPYQYVGALPPVGPQGETRFGDSAEHGEDAQQAEYMHQPNPGLLHLNLDGLQDRGGGHETLGSTRGLPFSGIQAGPLVADGVEKTPLRTTQEVLITGQSMATPALRGSAHAAISGQKRPDRLTYSGDRGTIKRMNESGEPANHGIPGEVNTVFYKNINSKRSKHSPVLASQASQFESPSKHDGSPPQSSRPSPHQRGPPPFRIQLDRKKRASPYKQDTLPDKPRYHLEVRGAPKDINNYSNLQQKITENFCQQQQNNPSKFHGNVDMINMAHQAFHEIDILIQEGATRSPPGSKDCTKSPATFAPNRNEPGRALKASPVHSHTSLNSMTHRDRFNDIEDEDHLNVSPKQGFLNLPKYGPTSKLNHNAVALTGAASPKQGQSRFSPYTPPETQDHRLQSDLVHYPEFGEGLEIQGTEVRMLDPHLAKQSLQKRNQIIRKIDRDQMKTPLKTNNESMASPQNGKITVTMDPKSRDFQVMEERLPSRQVNLGSRRYEGAPVEPPANQDLHSGQVAINTSIFGRNSPIQNNTLNLNIKTDAQHQLDVTLHQTQREDPDNTIDLPLSNKGERKLRQSHAHIKNQHEVEHNSSVAAGTSSSISQKQIYGPGAPTSQFMIDDIKLFRDFVLYYNKSRFKKLKAKKHMKNDLIFLNQDQICKNEEITGLYYQLREQTRQDTHMKSVKSKIEKKMEEIRTANKKHRDQLIKQGDLMDDESEKELEKIIAEFSKQREGEDEHDTQHKTNKISAVLKKDRKKSEQIRKKLQENTKQHQINEEKIFQDTMIQMNRRAHNVGPLLEQAREHSLEKTMPTVTIDSRVSKDVSKEHEDVCVYEANTVRPQANQNISKFVVQDTTRTQNQQVRSVHLQGLLENSPIKYRQDSIISKEAGSAASTQRGMGLVTTGRGKDSWNLASSMVERDSLKLKDAMKFNTRKSVKLSEIKEAMFNNHYLGEIKNNFSVRHPDCSKIGYSTTRGRVDLMSTGQTQQESQMDAVPRTPESNYVEKGNEYHSVNRTTNATVDCVTNPNTAPDLYLQNRSGAGQRVLSNTPQMSAIRPVIRNIGRLRASLDIRNTSLFSPGGTQDNWKNQVEQRRGMLKTTLHTGRVKDKIDSTRASFNNTQNKFHNKPFSPLEDLGSRRGARVSIEKQSLDPKSLAPEYIILKDQQTEQHETSSLYEQEQQRLFGGSVDRRTKRIESVEYIDYLSSKGAMLPVIAQNHAEQMAEVRASKGWQKKQDRVDDTKLFHIDLYHQRAQRKQQSLQNSVFESLELKKKDQLKINQQTIDYIGTLLPSAKERSGHEAIKSGTGVPHPRLLENRLNTEAYGGDNMNFKSNATPKMDHLAGYDHVTLTSERPSIFSHQNLQKAAKRVNNSVDFSNIQAPHGQRKSLHIGKRLKAKQHMIPFQEIKASEFTKAKLKMRNTAEERDRLLGPQFTKEYIKAKNAQDAAYDREQLQALDNFLRDGLNDMDQTDQL